METRNHRFRRLATSRMSHVYQDMNLIANLGNNTSKYFLTPNEVSELFSAYQAKGDEVHQYFQSPVTLVNTVIPVFTFTTNESVPEADQHKHEQARKLATQRMSRVFATARLIANLSNRNNYSFTPAEVSELFAGYRAKGEAVEQRFTVLETSFTFSTSATPDKNEDQNKSR